jgi:hypothetical protein
VSLIIRLLAVPENEREPFTVIYPLIVILNPLRELVWGAVHVGFQLEGVSHLPV